MPEIKIRPVPLPVKGLDYRKPGWELEQGYAPNSQDFWIYKREGRKRKGYADYGSNLPLTGSGAVAAITEFETFAGTNYLLAITVDDVFKYDPSTDNWGSLSASLSGDIDYPISFTEMNNNFIFTNYIDEIKKWTGSGNVAALGGASAYKAKVVKQFYNHLFLLHTTESGTPVPQRVRWSDVGDPEDWSTGDAGSNDLVDVPGWIVGAELLADHLVIYKEDSIILCDWSGGTSIFSFTNKILGTGLYAQNSLVYLKDRHYFLGNDNVYAYDGSNILYEIGNAIKDELFTTINAEYKDRIFAFKSDQYRQYWLCVPTTTAYPDTAWVYNWEEKSWLKFKLSITAGGFYSAQVLSTWDAITSTWNDIDSMWDDKIFADVFPALLFGSSDGYIRQFDYLSTNDGASAIDGYFETPDYIVKEEKSDRALIGRWLGVKFYAQGDEVTISYSTDEGTNWTATTAVTLAATWDEYTVPFDVTSDKLRLRFRNNTAGESFKIQSKYEIMYQEKAE